MTQNIRVVQLADALSAKTWKSLVSGTIHYSDSDELFFEHNPGQFVYLFKYGFVCFYGFSDQESHGFLSQAKEHSRNLLETDKRLKEDWEIVVGAATQNLKTIPMEFTTLEEDGIRLLMLNITQSLALDHYSIMTERILESTRTYTTRLEEQGKITLSGKDLKKYIGRVLNIKNKISENLYIFDSPEIIWEDPALNQLNSDLKAAFDLKDRFRCTNLQLDIVKENLELFKDITFHSESSKLEWIIIILILVEVADLFFIKIGSWVGL